MTQDHFQWGINYQQCFRKLKKPFLNLKTSTISFHPEVAQKHNIKVLTISVTQAHLLILWHKEETWGERHLFCP